MLLLQFSKWFGPSRYARAAGIARGALAYEERTVCAYLTRKSLNEALADVAAYERAFKENYKTTAVEHTLLAVQTLPEDLDAEGIEASRLSVIEDMLTALRAELLGADLLPVGAISV